VRPWRVIERAQELSIVLRIVEIDFHKTSFLITRILYKPDLDGGEILPSEISFEAGGASHAFSPRASFASFRGISRAKASFAQLS
jgi:hypothetical protein